jgi:hypothetical protein
MEGRPMFRFTLRELVLLTVVVGLGLGWWIDQWQLRVRVERAEFLWHHFEHFKWEQERIHRRNQEIVGLFLDAGGQLDTESRWFDKEPANANRGTQRKQS